MKKRKKRKKSTVIKNLNPNTSSDNLAPISLCMIVKDEERFLKDCLTSVQGLVTEIVVVDTGSTDRTTEIAAQFGAKIFHFEWNDDFSAARNFALQQATQPWILYLDADERLHSKYHELVKKAVQNPRYDAYYVFVTSQVGERLGNIPHMQSYPRLFRRMPGVEFTGRVHEQITPSLIRAGARFGRLDVEVEHLGYNQDEATIEQKIQRNLSLLQKHVQEQPDDAYALFQLGQTYVVANRVVEGETYLQKAIKSGKLSKAITANAILILANEAFKRGEYSIAIEHARQADQLVKRQRVGWFLLSECYGRLGEWEKAIAALENLQKFSLTNRSDLSLDKIFEPYIIHQRKGIYYFKLKQYARSVEDLGNYFIQAPTIKNGILEKYFFALSRLQSSDRNVARKIVDYLIHNLALLENIEEAIPLLASFVHNQQWFDLEQTLWERVMEMYPSKPEYPFYLGNLYLQQGDIARAEAYFQQSLKLNSQVYETHYNLAVVAIKKGDLEKAIKLFEQMKQQFPEKSEIIQRRLTALYFKTGNLDRALSGVMSNL